MRYVDRTKLIKPTGWNLRAQAASICVSNGESPKDYDAIWRELKDGLANLLHDKCWYCETPVERSDNAVDHFRPKNRVSDAAMPHPGYRWLAFDETNYRYACTYCNSRRKDVEGGTAGGKADRFPLINEPQRVYVAGSVALEQPSLLDPCEISDWRLLGCHQENGQPCATGTDLIAKQRAELSIEIYHLHHEPTCKRRHAVAVQLMSDVDEAKRLFDLATQEPGRATDFKAAAARLRRAIDRDSPYSGDMHFLLRGQRSDAHLWIQELLEA
jgi:5-methylcytosine-specific restriction endonuclease McrA